MQSVKKLLLILSLFCILISIVLIHSHDKGIETGEIASISDLTELDYKQGYYYYGRPDCIDCIKFQKELEKFLKTNNVAIKYINTAYWKKNVKFIYFLEGNRVDTVPVIIYYENNHETNRLTKINELKSFFNKK